MMQELLQVKQEQAKYIKSLLKSATYQGLLYFDKLERLNQEDTAREMDRERPAQARHNQDVSRFDRYNHYPTNQGPQGGTVYARVTKSHNVNNNANTHQVANAKTSVFCIRSLPQTGVDDIIVINNPSNSSADTASQPANCLKAHKSVSRQHTPLPPAVPDKCDFNGVYSLVQAVPPEGPPTVCPSVAMHFPSRQNASRLLPPTMMSPTHTDCEKITNRGSVSQSDRAAETHNMQSNHSDQAFQHKAQEMYDDVILKAAPTDSRQENISFSQCHHVSKVCSSRSPVESRKRSPHPVPPSPQFVGSTEADRQTRFAKHDIVGTQTAVKVDMNVSKPQLLTDQPSTINYEYSKLFSELPRKNRSPSPFSSPPSSVSCEFQRTPVPSHPISTSPYRSWTSSNVNTNSASHRMSSVIIDEEAPPPPPRKSSVPTRSPIPPRRKESSETADDVFSMPPVPPHSRNSLVEPNVPPRSSREVTENHESSKPVASPFPSRDVIQEVSELQSKKLERQNATRIKPSESLTSLPEHEESTCLFNSMGEGVISRSVMQRRLTELLGPPISRSRALSNESSKSVAKEKLRKRTSDPSSQVPCSIPIHKMPLPPIPIQLHSSLSSPQLETGHHAVYEDLDEAGESVNQDVLPQDHYEDLDMECDKPADHYEDLDYDDDKDRPRELYEDINNEAAQRISFVTTGPLDYTQPISRRRKEVRGPTEPEDYTPPITRRSVTCVEGGEVQDYSPLSRRGGGYPDELEDKPAPVMRRRVHAKGEPQDYTAPIRRSRVYFDEEEPEEYSPPIDRKSAEDPTAALPPVPPRSSSRQQHNHHRAQVTIAQPRSHVSSRVRPHSIADEYDQLFSHNQQPTTVSPPRPIIKDRPIVPSRADIVAKVRLKKPLEEQKNPPLANSGSVFSSANLFAELQSLQLRRTKTPNSDSTPPKMDNCDTRSSAPAVPFHSALKRTQTDDISQTVSQPSPRVNFPAPRPNPNKPPPPSLKPKPAYLLSPKHKISSSSPLHSKVNSRSCDPLGVV